MLEFLIAVVLVVLFWPLIKAYALFFLLALVIYLVIKHRNSGRNL